MLLPKSLVAGTLFAVAGLLTASTTHASDLLVDRGLPNANLNNAAGSNRSNTAWADGDHQNFTGDDFTITGAGLWKVDTIRTWVVANTNTLNSLFNSVTLYGGAVGTGVTQLETGDLSGSNANIVITPVTYDGGSTYQTTSGAERQIFQVDFTNLNLLVAGGTTIQFGVQAGSSTDAYWFSHASNAALSGTPQDGSNGEYLVFNSASLGAGGTAVNSLGNGWDKSSDINVQVFGSAVPEPSALVLAGVASLVFGGGSMLRRRNRRSQG